MPEAVAPPSRHDRPAGVNAHRQSLSSLADQQRRQRPGARGWRRWLVVAGAVVLLAWSLFAPPPAPAGGSRLGAFSPEQLASLEQEAWEAYYYRQWPRLFWALLQVMRGQFGLSWAQALYAAYLNTQAQLAFARQGDQGGEAAEALRRFYALVRQPLGASYDVDRVAAAELRWWVVHRQRHNDPGYTALTQAMTELYAELYGVPAERLTTAAAGRVQAVVVSDQWLAAGQPAGSPLLGQVRAELLTGYRALKAALLAASTPM